MFILVQCCQNSERWNIQFSTLQQENQNTKFKPLILNPQCPLEHNQQKHAKLSIHNEGEREAHISHASKEREC